jgi:hypothetical protein
VWSPRQGKGVVDYAPNFSGLDLSGDDILILARNTYLLKEHIEPELRRNGVIYEKNGYNSVKESTLKAIVDWEKLRNGGTLTVPQIVNVYDLMSSGIGVKRGFKKLPGFDENQEYNMSTLIDSGGLMANAIWHQSLDKIPNNDKSYIIAARRRGEKLTQKPRIKIGTIHSVKGGEADHVILMKDLAYKTYREMSKNPDPENRVFYVGVTRAKIKLTVVESSTNKFYPFL